jgi:hypothetical protein
MREGGGLRSDGGQQQCVQDGEATCVAAWSAVGAKGIAIGRKIMVTITEA